MKKVLMFIIAVLVTTSISAFAKTKVLIRNVEPCTAQEKNVLNLQIQRMRQKPSIQDFNLLILAKKGAMCSIRRDLNISEKEYSSWNYLSMANILLNEIKAGKAKIDTFSNFERELARSEFSLKELGLRINEYLLLKKSFVDKKVKDIIENEYPKNKKTALLAIYLLRQNTGFNLNDMKISKKIKTEEKATAKVTSKIFENKVIKMLEKSKNSISVTKKYAKTFIAYLKLVDFSTNKSVFSENSIATEKYSTIIKTNGEYVFRSLLSELYNNLRCGNKNLSQLPIILAK